MVPVRKSRLAGEIKRIKKEAAGTTFETTHSDIRKWFRIINREIFDRKLKFSDLKHVRIHKRVIVDIKDKTLKDGIKGAVRFNEDSDKRFTTLTIKKSFSSKRMFLNTLSHECVHIYEWMVDRVSNESPAHGETFNKWIPIFKRYGIIL